MSKNYILSILKFEKMKDLSIKKIVIVLLSLLLIISLIPWSYDGLFSKTGNGKWVSVGSKSIGANLILSEYNDFIQKNYTYIQQNPMVLAQYLNNLIGQYVSVLLFANEASDIHLSVDKSFLLNLISKIPAFKNENGEFDKNRFQSQIKNVFGSEKVFLDTISNNILKDQLMESIYPLVNQPYLIGYLDYLAISQERAVLYIQITPNLVKNKIIEPTDGDLTKLADQNKAIFTLPETRSADVYTINVKALTENITVSNVEIEDYYNKNLSLYILPETRDISQIIFSTQQEAQDAYDKLKSYTLKKATEEYSLINIGVVSKDDIPSELSSDVFKMQANIFSSPIKSDLGWHIVYVNKIIPQGSKPLASLKQEISAELISQKKNNVIESTKNELLNHINTNNEKKSNSKWKYYNVQNITSQSKSFDSNVVSTIFQTPQGSQSQITDDTMGNLFIVKTNNVSSEKMKDFNAIKPTLKDMWYKQESNIKMQELASELSLELSNNKPIKSLGYDISQSNALLTDDKSVFSSAALDIIFDSEKNKPIQSTLSNGYLFVGVVSNIKNKSLPYKNKNGIKNQDILNYNNYANQSYTQSFIEVYAKILEGKYGVFVDEKSILETVAPNRD